MPIACKTMHTDPRVPHLSVNELKVLKEKEITIKRLAIVRNVFVFSCYTDFAYVDVANLTADHLKIGDDGKKCNKKSSDDTKQLFQKFS